jgi:signal transduction histidine kinase
MRLVLKVTVAIAIGITLVLVIHGYRRVQRETRLFEMEARRDQATLGTAVAEAVAEVASGSGREHAMRLLRRIHAEENGMRVTWVPDTQREGEGAGARQVPGAIEHVEVEENGERVLLSRVPLDLGDGWIGHLEMRESLVATNAYVRSTIERVVVTSLLSVAACAVMIAGLGWWLVGRPLRRVVDKVRRAGSGDLEGPLDLGQRDEIGQLAGEVDVMCAQLAAARTRAERESAVRVRTVEQLRHADRLTTVGHLASGVAHELGTPLNVVLSRSNAIARGESTGDEAKTDARVCAEQVERMSRIIRQLLDFARVNKPRKEVVELEHLVRATLAMLEPLAARNGVALRAEVGAPTLAVVADPDHVRQVVTNLVVNAIQAQPAGGAVRVRLDATRLCGPTGEWSAERVHAKLVVEDEGMGISPEDLPHVFEPFFTTKDVGLGTGLGLSVAYGIVQEHGGWMEVDSAGDQGTSFMVYLPLEVA